MKADEERVGVVAGGKVAGVEGLSSGDQRKMRSAGDERLSGCSTGQRRSRVCSMGAAGAAAAAATATAASERRALGGDMVAAAFGGGCGGGGGGGGRSVAVTASSVLMLLVTVIASCALHVQADPMSCNEYEKCYTLQQQINVSNAIQENNKAVVCSVATTAIQCLQEARKDCDTYDNMPSIIINGLEGRKSNLTSYSNIYCDSNGSDVSVGGNVSLVTLLWSVLLPVWLSSSFFSS